jgi:chemotaxis family two-component system sensor kinase Cph1
VLSLMVERVVLSERALAEERIEMLRAQVARKLAEAEDIAAGLVAASDAMLALIPSERISVVVGQRVTSVPTQLNRAAALELADYMGRTHQSLLATDSLLRDLHQLTTLEGVDGAAGLLAIQLVGETAITIIWWRPELVETVDWAGSPSKGTVVVDGLTNYTPRKSFEVWRQTTRGTSAAWGKTDRFAARELKVILEQVALQRIQAAEHERAALLAIMGHDLRDPLQAIDMAVAMMTKGLVSSGDSAKRIEYSSSRMQSLISYILDVSRLRTGLGLAMEMRKTDLAGLVEKVVTQARLAHPGVEMVLQIDGLGECQADSNRLIQALSNLLANARHHGDMQYPVEIKAYRSGDHKLIELRNRLVAGQEFVPGPMTSPFNAASSRKPKNVGGLGLGLYIANAIISGHGGRLESSCEGDVVCFTVILNE